MLKKTITYTDFNDVERTEDFYFNLTKTELTQMQLSTEGGLKNQLDKIIATKDTKRVVEVLKDIIINSYGEKSPDGRRFIKTQEVKDSFEQTEAFSIMFIEMLTNAELAADFVNGIIPKNMPTENVLMSISGNPIPLPPRFTKED